MTAFVKRLYTYPRVSRHFGTSKSYCFAVLYGLCLLLALYISASHAASSDDSQAAHQSIIDLSSEEKAWLSRHPEVLFTGDPNWLPYEAFTEKGEYIGIVAEHLKLISKYTGLKFRMSPSQTWTESTIKAKNGEVDILSETDDSDLISHLDFTQSYLTNPIVIAMRSTENYVENLDAIKTKRIGMIRDYGYVPKILRKYPNINFVTVENIQDGLISVSTGKVDALLCNLALCSYTIHELGMNDVKITGNTEFDTRLALAVQKNNPMLLSILNKGIGAITKGEQQVILDDWVKHEYIETVDYTLVYTTAIVSIIILSLFFYWNRRLSNEINRRTAAEKLLIESSETNERYRILFFESQVGHALNRFATGEFLSVNAAFSRISGYSLEELNKLSYWDLTPERYAAQEQEQLDSLKTTGKYGPYEKHYIHKNGYPVAVRLNGSLITDKNGEQLILSVVEDISAYSEAREKLRLSSLVLENSSEAMMITDKDNKIIAVNPAFCAITGYRFDEVKGQDPDLFKSGRHDDSFYAAMWESLNKTGQWQGEVWDKKKNGEIYAKWLTIDTIKDETGQIIRYVALFSDITERKQADELIWRQANYDLLTGLPNRNQFQQKLQQQIEKSAHDKQPFTLLLIDLDYFKEVNDTLGHDKGDILLRIAAKRITHCSRGTDVVARLGGDEFTIIVAEFEDMRDVDTIAEKLIATLSEPYHLDGQIVHISASVGITMYPDDATTIEALIKNADQAMYYSKNKGRNRHSRFTQSLQDMAQKKLRISNDLRNALPNREFVIYYQPIIDMRSNRITKAEALLRWLHPEQGLIPPLEFISIAEDIGIITEIGDWVCRESLHTQKHWQEKLNTDIKISVNMSPVHFKVSNKDFGKGWLDSPDRINLTLEITEGLLLNSEPEILQKLHMLRDAGVEVSIDDFGTGYSSLSYLKAFHIDYLKIDQSFIKHLETDPNDLALSEAIIVMAHKLGLLVVAEGVETMAQHNILANAGCDYAQGYLYSRPVPLDEFETLLTTFIFNNKGSKHNSGKI